MRVAVSHVMGVSSCFASGTFCASQPMVIPWNRWEQFRLTGTACSDSGHNPSIAMSDYREWSIHASNYIIALSMICLAVVVAGGGEVPVVVCGHGRHEEHREHMGRLPRMLPKLLLSTLSCTVDHPKSPGLLRQWQNQGNRVYYPCRQHGCTDLAQVALCRCWGEKSHKPTASTLPLPIRGPNFYQYVQSPPNFQAFLFSQELVDAITCGNQKDHWALEPGGEHTQVPFPPLRTAVLGRT